MHNPETVTPVTGEKSIVRVARDPFEAWKDEAQSRERECVDHNRKTLVTPVTPVTAADPADLPPRPDLGPLQVAELAFKGDLWSWRIRCTDAADRAYAAYLNGVLNQ